MGVCQKLTIDFLIVGQGLAGTLLAWRLIQQGKNVLVVDPAFEQSASRTAAGLINPVTGKRLVKTAGVENYLPEAKKLYQQLSGFFGTTFFHKKEQIRLFQSEEEIKQWEKRKASPDYAPFLGERFSAGERGGAMVDTLGGFQQLQCGYLDTVLLLDKLRSFFKEHDCYLKATVATDDLKQVGQLVEWRDFKIKKVVFCEGYHLQNNSLFSWLPLQPVQGEILTLQGKEAPPKEVVQFGKWVVPLPSGQFKLGATWQWKPLDEQPNEVAVNELLTAYKKRFLVSDAPTLIEQKVGIRPGTRDKLPFLGSHPYFPNFAVFNGFGAKGSLMIPWYSDCFFRYLTVSEKLPEQVNIKRYANDCPAG